MPGTPQNHPRRPPAHKSVSLLHSPPGKRSREDATESQLSRASSTMPLSDRANPPSTDSSRPSTKKESSGEVSDAGNWFETSNNNISQNNTSFMDNDPPFFFRNSSSSTSPDMMNPLHMRAQKVTSIPHTPALMRMHTSGSSTADFRSVIDDLTIENKKLKKKLRRYEKIQDAHLQHEKLFEIRVHGLPAHKKRELEETLRKFTMGMEEDTTGDPVDDVRPSLPTQPTMSSNTSTHFADSAYHSMSASGHNSNTASGSKTGSHSQPEKSRYHRQQDSIQSYLQDIPAGLMPRTTVMTESTKRKLVVRRMEQIFAGKGAVMDGHYQPIQQQEVAQSAARADRDAIVQATGHEARKEGMREALIMNKARRESVGGARVDTANQKHKLVSEQDFAASGDHQSSDQRPTRPLDLDPQRAQIPTENINYIRHLGFSPPNPEVSPIDNHGWIYLNLLINMAQLHTVNVTTDFVKKAIQDYSTKLELSHDGRKVRWKGGHDLSLNSSDSSPEHELETRKPNFKRMHNKRQKFDPSSTNTSSEATSHFLAEQYRNHLAYTPLFHHKDSSEGYDSSNPEPNSEDVSPLAPPATGNTSSGFASSSARTSSSKRKRNEGPIIFYNKAKFCTDLSGDPSAGDTNGYIDYDHYSNMPLGAPPEQDLKSGNGADDERRGPLVRAALQDMDVDMVSSNSSDIGLDFVDTQSSDRDVSALPRAGLDFEASGIGGITPEDNFAIYVESKQIRQNGASVTNVASHTSRSLHYPDRVLRVLQRGCDKGSLSAVRRAPLFNREVVSVDHDLFPPSALPPPSLLPFGSSSGDADSDMSDASDTADEEFEDSTEPPTAARRMLDVTSPEDSVYEEEDGEDEDEDGEDEDEVEDSSVDFLAMARQADPETIRRFEREYDSNMAERLAEEIPAGSSAATAGGGSGFNTPISGGDGNDTDRRPSSRESEGLSRSTNLKRARTNDSMVMHGKAQKHE